MSPRETDGGVLVDDCRGCDQETIFIGDYCSDCQVDMQVGKTPGTFFREEQAKEIEHLRSENDALRARVGEHEAAGTTGWGVRWDDEPEQPVRYICKFESEAREVARGERLAGRVVVVKRFVPSPGPWVPADETGATS